MNEKIDNLTGKLFGVIVSIFIFWIVFKIAMGGYHSIADYFSGEQQKQETFKQYSNNLYTLLNNRDISSEDIIKITNHYNRESDNTFKEAGYDVILEDFYIQYLNDNNKSAIFSENLEDINELINSYKTNKGQL